jgi:hypothetical protein
VDTLLRISPERFAEGLSVAQFVEGMRKNREIIEENYRVCQIGEEDAVLLRESGPLNVLVLAEDWCGDVVRYLPVMARMAEAAGNWSVGVFLRDQNPDMADLCLKDGEFRAIPVFLLFDGAWNNVACLIEKPQAVYAAEREASRQFASLHPDLSDAAGPTSEMSEQTLGLYFDFIRQFRLSRRAEWQQLFVQELGGKLRKGLKKV